MGLQCFLFSSDEGSAATIRQVLADLDVHVESCPEAVAAVEKISKEPFQIVIIDWDQQPEAGLLLAAARERKASERPITLAIVGDDISVPKALQAGANSILRKPIFVNQIKDTLKTARDLLRAKRDPASPAAISVSAHSAAAAAPATIPASMDPGKEKILRAGEFLQSAPVTPGGAFVTESNVSRLLRSACATARRSTERSRADGRFCSGEPAGAATATRTRRNSRPRVVSEDSRC